MKKTIDNAQQLQTLNRYEGKNFMVRANIEIGYLITALADIFKI